MANHRQLSRAPVKEALVDIQFEQAIEIDKIDLLAERIQNTYPTKRDIWQASFGFSTENGQPHGDASNLVVGKRLESADGQYVVQCRRNGLSVSRLPPYTNWADLALEAHRVWAIFQEIAQVDIVSRIAVRYINEIKISLPFGDFGDFLICPPEVPKMLPQAISEFLTRVVIQDPTNNCVSIVTQALEGTQFLSPTSIAVVLDIDVFRAGNASANGEEIWTTLGILRNQKNRMFFEHLTEKTVEMYV